MPLDAHIPTLTEIQNFDTTGFTGFLNGCKAVDWPNLVLYIGGAQNAEVKSVNIHTWDTHDARVASVFFDTLMTCGEDGFIYAVHGAGPNCGRCNKIDKADLTTAVSFFGAAGGPFNFDTDATHWHVPFDMDSVVSHAGHYMVSSAFSAGPQISIINLDTMAWTGTNYVPDENRPVVTRGLDHAGNGCAYVLGAKAQGIALNLYRVEITALNTTTFTKLFTKAPHDLDPTWTHWDAPTGCVVDETDGNIIFRIAYGTLSAWGAGNTYALDAMVSRTGRDYRSLVAGNIGHDPATSPTQWEDRGPSIAGESRVAKINITTGVIMWSVVVGAITPGNMNDSLIQYGLYGMVEISGTRNFVFIRTRTGEVVRMPLSSVFADTQFWRDLDGTFAVEMSWGGGHPPAAHGTTPASFTGWGTFLPLTAAPSAFTFIQAQVFG